MGSHLDSVVTGGKFDGVSNTEAALPPLFFHERKIYERRLMTKIPGTRGKFCTKVYYDDDLLTLF